MLNKLKKNNNKRFHTGGIDSGTGDSGNSGSIADSGADGVY